MKKILRCILGALGLVGCVRESILSPADYTARCAAEIRKVNPALKVELVRDLQLRVADAHGKLMSVFLDNGYTEYRANPTELSAIVARYAASAGEPVERDRKLDPKRITPVIKDAGWLAEIRASLLARGAKEPPSSVFESFNDQLVIIYAEDTPRNLRYVTPKEIEATGLKRENLRNLAVNNLRGLLPKIELKGGKGTYMVTAGGNYEASLLLLDEIWTEKKIPVDGDYVVAIPSRDVLLVTGSNDKNGIAKLRELSKTTAAKSSYRLTSDLFTYRAGRFTLFTD